MNRTIAMRAIVARIDGQLDHPSLIEAQPLTDDVLADVERIAAAARPGPPGSAIAAIAFVNAISAARSLRTAAIAVLSRSCSEDRRVEAALALGRAIRESAWVDGPDFDAPPPPTPAVEAQP